MKTLIAALLVAFSMSAQIEIKPKTIAGEWTSNGEALDLVITETLHGIFIEAKSSTSKKNLTVLDVQLLQYSLIVNTLFEPNQWATQSRFVMINKDTMVAIITGDAEGEVLYTRTK
jgi:hypothetical protein